MSGRKNGHDFFYLLNQFPCISFVDFLGFEKHLEPKQRFICFLLNDSQVISKICFRARPSCGSIVCSNRRRRPNQLPSNDFTRIVSRQAFHKIDHFSGQTFRPLLQLRGVHQQPDFIKLKIMTSQFASSRASQSHPSALPRVQTLNPSPLFSSPNEVLPSSHHVAPL
jgi:hypothetical protein